MSKISQSKDSDLFRANEKLKKSINKIKEGEARLHELENQLKLKESRLEYNKQNLRSLLTESRSELVEATKLQIGQLDHTINIAKFIITISTTALFVAVGLPDKTINRTSLFITAIPTIVLAIAFATIQLNGRRKLVNTVLDSFVNRISNFEKAYRIEK